VNENEHQLNISSTQPNFKAIHVEAKTTLNKQRNIRLKILLDFLDLQILLQKISFATKVKAVKDLVK